MEYTTLFLDLDDTLYPHTSGLWEAVGGRIQSYIEMKLNLCTEDASLLRAQYLAQFGTTLNGLMRNHQIDPMEYLDYVHDVPVENLIPPDPELQTMLASISIPRIIFTNAYLDYAMRVLKQLGISDLIDEIIDILALDFSNKPDPKAYKRALAKKNTNLGYKMDGEVKLKCPMILNDFLKPKRLEADLSVSNETYGRFVVEPFERGFGVTVGNSLRRALLKARN